MDGVRIGSDRRNGRDQQLQEMLERIEVANAACGGKWRRQLPREYVEIRRALRERTFDSDLLTLSRIRRLTTRDGTTRAS